KGEGGWQPGDELRRQIGEGGPRQSIHHGQGRGLGPGDPGPPQKWGVDLFSRRAGWEAAHGGFLEVPGLSSSARAEGFRPPVRRVLRKTSRKLSGFSAPCASGALRSAGCTGGARVVLLSEESLPRWS